jgi:hypothetical protein
MEVITQYLGHEDVNMTRKKYARYSPTYPRGGCCARIRRSRFNEPEEHYIFGRKDPGSTGILYGGGRSPSRTRLRSKIPC